jgi:dihydroneopterin aldolase
MHDTVLVRNLQFHAHHGVFDEERAEGRRFAVDVEVDVARTAAGETDELRDTVDYREVAQAVCDVMSGPSHHLVEALAHDMASALFARLPGVHAARIEIRKRATGVPGDPEWVGVRIARHRSET